MGMANWMIHANMEEIDVHQRNCIRYIRGKRHYVDLPDIHTFFVHDIDDIMDKRGYVEPHMVTEKMYYHFQRPLGDLDFGLFALASDDDVHHLARYIGQYKMTYVYEDHGEIKLHTYSMSPNPYSVTNQTNSNDVDMESVTAHECFGANMDMENEHDTGNEDEDYLVHEDNMIHDVDVDMHYFHMNIDHNFEWARGAVTTTSHEAIQEDEELEVIDNDVFLTESSSDDGNEVKLRKTIKAIQREHSNDNAHGPTKILRVRS
uniref:Uncharacterized protein n=1 Tax=Lactuca sativa TaxID=4236 RepID=A0A9R1XNT1_LACSA|nr:hypothetical protein LSAT_V11C400162280 [Lactuca sativa]